MSRAKVALFCLIALIVGVAGYSLQNRTIAKDHGNHAAETTTALPSEVGQSAFAAIAEIVSILQADPETDWTKANISRLREHLVDMEMLTTRANVVATQTDVGMVFSVNGDDETRRAIQAMVPAHAKVLDGIADWSVAAKLTLTGAEIRISSTSALERTKIQALGFFGIMATGAHHQSHHLAMAKGLAHGH